VRPGGTVLVIGMDATCTAGVRVFDMVRQEKTITGCFVNNDLIPVALDIIPSLSLHELITHRFALAEIHQALAALRDGSSLKALVDLRRKPT
jgi:threonine dehydrogenase-like Zn-dependent dehydrogenase